MLCSPDINDEGPAGYRMWRLGGVDGLGRVHSLSWIPRARWISDSWRVGLRRADHADRG